MIKSSKAKQTLQEGFEKFVVKMSNGCWDWNGCCPQNPGYGQFRSLGVLHRAHRASWILHYGDIPKDKFVCHKCDNKKCTNPEHLFLASCKQNNIDMMEKNRSPILGKKGSLNPNSKLTESDILSIRSMLQQHIPQNKIANEFNVSQSAISVINTKRYWR